MFGLIRKRRPVIHVHWYVPLLDFESDTGRFYQAVEEDLRSRNIPDSVFERILFSEAGMLSAKREYLRVRRERLAYDLCSAPHGTGWWFSGRGVVLPRILRVWEIALTALGLLSFYVIYVQIFGFMTGSLVLGSSILCLLMLFFAAAGRPGLDDFLLHLPVVGALYEAFARPETYYRQDLRLMFCETANAIVRSRVQEFCRAGGVDDPPFVTVKARQILTTREMRAYENELPA